MHSRCRSCGKIFQEDLYFNFFEKCILEVVPAGKFSRKTCTLTFLRTAGFEGQLHIHEKLYFNKFQKPGSEGISHTPTKKSRLQGKMRNPSKWDFGKVEACFGACAEKSTESPE